MLTLGRQREKQHAANYVRNEADTLIIGSVIDAVHDLMEGIKHTEAVVPVFCEAFIGGGSGTWEQTGSWLKKLTREHPSLSRIWLQLASHKSAKIRLRVAGFLNDMPDEIRQQITTNFLADSSAKVRSRTAGEISFRPTLDMLPLLQNRLVLEADSEVVSAIKYALASFPSSNINLPPGHLRTS